MPRYLSFLLAACFAVLLPSCAGTSDKPHDYGLDKDEKPVNQKSWNMPSETFDGNPLGNMPQSR